MGWSKVKEWTEENQIVLTIVTTVSTVLTVIIAYLVFLQSRNPQTMIIMTPTPRAPSQIAKSVEGAWGWGPNLTVDYLSAGTAWTDSTSATIGDTVGFFIEIHNTNIPSTAKNVLVKVNLPATPSGGTITSTANATTTTPTTVADSKTDVTDSTQIINLPANALLRYQTGSLRVSADLNGDGTKEYDNFAWANDNLTTNGLDLGNLEGSAGTDTYVQMSFKAKVIEGGAPNLTVKHLSANSAHPADGWADTTTAAPGDALQFYIEVHNTNVPSVAKNLTVRVDSPNGEGDSLTSLVTADVANATAVADSTTVNFSAPAKWTVRSEAMQISWDRNGDGVLDYNRFIWPNDDLFSSEGLNLGELGGCNPYIVQISFWVDTESLPRTPLDLVTPD